MDSMLLAKAAVMGVVEGLTEFLPISSTGHLILAGALLGFDDDKAKVFDIAIQTGAIFAVILVYWEKIRSTLKALRYQVEAQRFVLNVFIGFLPAVILGLLFGKLIMEAGRNTSALQQLGISTPSVPPLATRRQVCCHMYTLVSAFLFI